MDRPCPRAPRGPTLCIALCLALLLAGPAAAITIDITSFENGELIPSGGDVIGHTGRRQQIYGVDPTDGSRMFITSTRETSGATDPTSIENAMGIPTGTIDDIFGTIPGTTSATGPTSGSAFRITFAAQAGDILNFDWNFVTQEDHPEDVTTDFGWSHLAFEGASVGEGNLGNALTSTFVDTSNNMYDQTGWQTVNFNLGSTGSYTLTLGVSDVEDLDVDSFMLFDWFYLSRAPEPGTASLLGMGLLGLAWRGRRRS